MDLYTLALEIKSKGLAEAKLGLKDIDNYGKNLGKSFQDSLAPLERMKGALLAVGAAAAGAAALAVGAMLKKAITEATEAEHVLNDLRQAVNNVGGDFELLKPATDAAADSINHLTRFSDEAARGALTKLILVSNDTAGSLRNLSLVTDIAVARHTSLESAAELVGRVMAGNTRGLKALGIETKDSAEAIAELNRRYRGFAEEDGQSFQGRLEQLKNAWSDVLEAIGKNIIAGNEMQDGLGAIRDKLVELQKYIEANGAAWREQILATAGKVVYWWKLIVGQGDILGHKLNVLAEAANIAGLTLNTAFMPWKIKANVEEIAKHIEKLKKELLAAAKAQAAFDNLQMFGDVAGGSSSGTKKGTGTGSGNNRPSRSGGGGTGSSSGQPNIPIYNTPGAQPERGPMKPVIALPVPAIDPWIIEIQKRIEEAGQRVADTIQGGFAQTLGDAIYNAFAAAFNGEGIGGIFKAFGKTILAGVGQIFTQLGMVYLQYGVIMTALAALLPNPFTAGWAGLAIGAALIAMGAALGAVAHGGAGRGTASAGAFRERAGGTEEITRLKFVNRDGSGVGVTPRPNYNITIIGANDPAVNRQLSQMLDNHARR